MQKHTHKETGCIVTTNPARKPSDKALIAPLIRDQYRRFRESSRIGDEQSAWQALEWEHILSQPFTGAHFASHWHMLQYAIELRDWREATGQAMRLLLVPLGSLTGRLPAGNSGRARVSAFEPMPIPPELHTLIEAAGREDQRSDHAL
ncbi:DUF3703 domain-containing protein [Sphingopyxis sp.]|uniref:DUF3703 domain-containing protein n=1 Tax=Sphingopyxis sp. TaxID=1908224 RepID=UPI0035AF1112